MMGERGPGPESSAGREEREKQEERERKEKLARRFFEIAEIAGMIVSREGDALERGELTRSSLNQMGAEIARVVWRRACDELGIDDDTRDRILGGRDKESREKDPSLH